MGPSDQASIVVSRGRGRMSLADLPPADTKRWVASRKAAVVAAVEQKLISVDDACARYGLTPEEFESWRAALGEFGVGALRATRLQLYRSS